MIPLWGAYETVQLNIAFGKILFPAMIVDLWYFTSSNFEGFYASSVEVYY